MEKILNEIDISSTSGLINSILSQDGSKEGFSFHYNQNEESFIKLDNPFTVPHFPIHHDINIKEPGPEYLESLAELMKQTVPQISSIFDGMTYFFDPSEIFHPCFYQLYKYKERLFLYLIRLDLIYKPSDGEIIETGSNDVTNAYRTSKLFMEADIIPLVDYKSSNGKITNLVIEQNISETWIGETGRGYVLEGIWIDQELTKFLSKLMLPQAKRTYPYYPFTCKYRTLCHTVADFSRKGRKRHLLYLHTARDFLLPLLDEIQEALKQNSFSTEMPAFRTMKAGVPEYWKKVWEPLTVKPYLNEHDMKEFLIDF